VQITVGFLRCSWKHIFFIFLKYIFKIIFQLIFAACPVIVFFILQKTTSKVFAFLSTFFFLSFPTFFNDMPMLTRQEIGFIFFGALIYVAFTSTMQSSTRRFLFLLFGISIIISHYSTNYVTIALILFVVTVSAIIKIFPKRENFSTVSSWRDNFKNLLTQGTFINISLFIFLVVATFVWNTAYTKTSNNLGDITSKIINGIFIPSGEESRSSDTLYSIFFAPKKNEAQLLSDFISGQVKQAKETGGEFYDKADYSSFSVKEVSQRLLPLTVVGKFLQSLHFPVFTFQLLLRSFSAGFMQLAVVIGMAVYIFFRKRKPFDLQFVLLSLGGIILIALVIVLPDLSAEYGLLRLFDQMLFLLSLPIVLSLDAILFFIKPQKRVYFIGIIAVIFFLNLTGFIAHLTGGYYPQLILDNAGLYYDSFYIKRADIASAKWLTGNKNNSIIQSDISGNMILLTYADTFASDTIIPQATLKNSYVYLPSADSKDYVSVSVNGDVWFINSPEPFLDRAKNVIYDNGVTKIYK
jgi:uncharacterized membrane protein